MTKVFKIGTLLLLVTLISISCTKSIIIDEPGQLDDRNVELKIFNYWGNNLFRSDSTYTVNGTKLKVYDVQLLTSNFFYVNGGDTSVNWNSYTLTTTKESKFKIGAIDETGVSGGIGFLVGLDSLSNSTKPSNYSDGEVLANGSIYSGDVIGYNFITITGAVFDPNKPDETEPSIPLKWVVATEPNLSAVSINKNFSIPQGKQIEFNVLFKIDVLFEGMNPLATPIIKSDPADAADFAEAIKVRDNFRNKSFNIQ